MKQVLIASLITFGSLTAFAQPVQLKPGSSVVINGDLITCEAPVNDPNALQPCSIIQHGSAYRIYVGQNIAQSYYRFDEALEGVKQMKQVGLCR